MSSLPLRSNVVFHLAYDGSSFLGWQKTGSGKSVEEALESVLTQILRHPIQIEAASRLDRGVHARGQVVSIKTNRPLPDLFHRANCLLPPTIRILKQTLMEDSFHPTLHAKKKEYRYLIDNGSIQSPFHRNYSWHIKEPLNVEAMQQVCKKLIGTHNFKAFCNFRKGLNYTSYERTLLELRLEKQGNLIEIHIVGTHFLYKMCRNIVGLLVGYGKNLPLPPVEEILHSQERHPLHVTAPASGLFLHEVIY